MKEYKISVKKFDGCVDEITIVTNDEPNMNVGVQDGALMVETPDKLQVYASGVWSELFADRTGKEV